jgi:hypothetical protein
MANFQDKNFQNKTGSQKIVAKWRKGYILAECTREKTVNKKIKKNGDKRNK